MFGRKKKIVIINRPMPDEEALSLVREGILKPHEAPMAMLRDLQRRQK